MKKICYVISTLQKTGPVNVLYNLVKNLDRTQFEPCIITLSKEPQNSSINDFKKLNIDIVSLNLGRTKSFFLGPKKLKTIVDRINPDIVHSHCFRSSLFSAISLDKYKKTATIHCDYKTDFKMFYGKFFGYMMYMLMNYSLKKIKNNICVSKQLSDILNEREKNIKFNYIDNGIDTDYFKPAENKTELREKLNLSKNKKIFIWCGTFIERKSPLTLVNAVKQIKNENLFFVFCGEGKYLDICKKELMENKNVLFTGYVKNIKEYLQASDYYISTSLSEGFHLTVYEALSCGLPTILTDIFAYDELTKKEIGLFFKAKDIKDLKDIINDILNIDYVLYSNNAINLIENKFSSKLMSKKYQEFYEDIC